MKSKSEKIFRIGKLSKKGALDEIVKTILWVIFGAIALIVLGYIIYALLY